MNKWYWMPRLYRDWAFFVRPAVNGTAWYACCKDDKGGFFLYGPVLRRCDALHQCGLFVDALLDTPSVPTIHLEGE